MLEVFPDVLIVGAGPIGCSLALGLRRKGLNVMVVEKQTKPQKVFKGEYLQPGATQFLRRLNLEKVFAQPSAQAVKELRFRDLNEKGGVISEVLMAYPKGCTALAISHFELISALRDHVQEEAPADTYYGADLKPLSEESTNFHATPQFMLKKADKSEVLVTPRWVIGCDGRNSTVRKWMGGSRVPLNRPITLGAKEELIVGAEISTSPPLAHRYEVFRFHTKGTLSSFSLGEHGQRLYLSREDEGRPSDVKKLRKELGEMLQTVNRVCKLGEMEENSPIPSFPAFGMWFGSVCRGAFMLAGDAACVTSPYGGQGLTAGMEHGEYLLDNFDFFSSGSGATDAYAQVVRRSFERITILNFGLYYLFFARAPIFKKVSAYVLWVWENNPEMKDRVMRLFGGLDRDRPSVAELLQLWGLSIRPSKLLSMVPLRMYFGK